VKAPNATRDPVFDAAAKCPVYVIPDEVADAVQEKQQADDAETAKLVAKGVPVARINTGIDGGMHKIFASKLPDGNTGLSEGSDGQGLSLALTRAPGTIPSHVNPPHALGSDEPGFSLSTPSPQVASTTPNAQSDSFLASLARKVGLGAADTTASAQAVPAKPKVAEAKVTEAKRADTSIPKASVAAPKAPDTKQAAAPTLKPSLSAAPAPTEKDGLVAGAQPVVSSNTFDSRFSAIR
jgi:hypothetical protein